MWQKLKDSILGLLTSKKVLMAIVGFVLSFISGVWPDAPLPPIEWIVALIVSLIGGHTATDIAAIRAGLKVPIKSPADE